MTFRLSTRGIDILSLLIESEKPLSAGSLAKHLKISARMVRTSLEPCEKWLRVQNIALKKTPGVGLSIVGSNKERKTIARMLREYKHPQQWLSPADRPFVILVTLFFAEKPLKLMELQQVLDLCRTTTLEVVNSAETWLKYHNLTLIRRPNFGYLIVGDELDWREAVVNLLMESCSDARLLALFRGRRSVVDVPYHMITRLEEILNPIWEQLDISLINAAITDIEYTAEGTLSDHKYIEVCAYLAIALYRIKKEKALPPLTNVCISNLQDQQKAAARKISEQIIKLCGVRLSREELNWLATKIPEANSLGQFTSGIKSSPVNQYQTAVHKSVESIINQASLSLHPSLRVDNEIIQNLTMVLESFLDQQASKRTPDARFLQSLKDHYPNIHSVVEQSSEPISKSLNRRLTEVEMGEIMLCLIASLERLNLFGKVKKNVLVVCSAGMATAWLLVSRLRTEFPDIEVVEVISVLDLERRKKFDGIDFIIGTVPIRVKNITSMQVNPLLGDEDLKRLREFFKRGGQDASADAPIGSTGVHLNELIIPASIALGITANSWQDVVEIAGGKLVEAGSIVPEFIQSMKDIIIEHGPYMVIWPGAVLLHAPPKGVKRLCMQFVSLKEPVNFGHPENDPVRIAIVLGAVDDHSHFTALMELNALMQNEDARAVIDTTMHKSVVLHWVSKYSR